MSNVVIIAKHSSSEGARNRPQETVNIAKAGSAVVYLVVVIASGRPGHRVGQRRPRPKKKHQTQMRLTPAAQAGKLAKVVAELPPSSLVVCGERREKLFYSSQQGLIVAVIVFGLVECGKYQSLSHTHSSVSSPPQQIACGSHSSVSSPPQLSGDSACAAFRFF